MKVQIICENCGKVVELAPETNGNLCYVQSKLNESDMYADVDIDAEISTDIDDVKKADDISDIDIDKNLNSIRFTCNNCGEYIELNHLI